MILMIMKGKSKAKMKQKCKKSRLHFLASDLILSPVWNIYTGKMRLCKHSPSTSFTVGIGSLVSKDFEEETSLFRINEGENVRACFGAPKKRITIFV